MALSRGNPISIEVLQVAQAIDDVELMKQIKELILDIRATDQELIGWLQKQAELVRIRLGSRKGRNIPWKNASNINVPLIDGIIRRWRPGVASLVLDAEPVAFFTAQSPSDFEAARSAEKFFTYLVLTYMESTYPVIQLVDLVAWRGHAYTREGWKYETSREARVVPIAHLFPNGLTQTVQQMQQQAARTQQDPPTAEDIVMTALESEYQLDRQDEREGPMLLAAVTRILAGQEYIKLVYRKVAIDRPDWAPIDPLNVIVPQNQNPEKADFFCQIHHMTRDQLKAMAIDGHLPAGRVDKLLKGISGDSEAAAGVPTTDGMRDRIQDIMDRVAGRSRRANTRQGKIGKIIIWEIFARLDINGDGERERCIVWYAPGGKSDGSDPIEGQVLAVLDYPYPFDTWPITLYPFEAAARPIDNRGIADMLRPLQKVVTAFHNARIDASQIVLAPVLLMRVSGGNYRKSIKWQPGSVIPVASTQDILPLTQNLAILAGLLQEEQVNQRLAETYVGVFDATLTNLQQRGERRTAAEVNAIQGISSNIFGLDAKIFQVALSKSFTKLWQLYVDLGPTELFFRVTEEELPRIARKHEINRSYDIRAAGTPANTNRSFQISALERIMSSPLTLPLMQAGRLDGAELFRQWVQLVDYNVAKRIIRSEEEGANVQLVLEAAQQAAEQRGVEPPPPII
jgi:hypothetical protein